MTQAFNLSQLANGVDSSGKLDLSTNSKNPSWTTDISANGVIVGKGAGSVSTNTAVGASALAANTTGTRNTAVGSGAAGATTTGNGVTAVGYNVLANNITGTGITAIGGSDVTSGGALQLNTSGNFNTAVGTAALFSNTTASNNTAVGYQAGYSNTTGAENSFLGYLAGNANTTGSQNTFIGRSSGATNQTGTEIVAVGFSAMGACGTAANYNTAIGRAALNNVTGTLNVGLGNGSGSAITSGSKNTIIGSYSGNQGGLDIRTASNHIVLSDGDGNPRLWVDNGPTLACPAVYTITSASAANVVVLSSGSIVRSTSALKYKQDVRDLEELDINLLRPVRYKSKCEGDDQTKDYFGVVADEVAEAGIEELVTRGADGEVEGFQYERLTVVLLKELQTLKAKVAALENQA